MSRCTTGSSWPAHSSLRTSEQGECELRGVSKLCAYHAFSPLAWLQAPFLQSFAPLCAIQSRDASGPMALETSNFLYRDSIKNVHKPKCILPKRQAKLHSQSLENMPDLCIFFKNSK